MAVSDRRYYTADEIRFLSDLLDRGRFEVLEQVTGIILRDERAWDEGIDVGRVKEHARKLRAVVRAMGNGSVA